MAVSSETRRRFAVATALRGLLMLLAGLYAIIWPTEALTVLMLAGAILLIIDGVLGLWSLTFGGGKSGKYWFDVVSNALALLLGIVILISPLLAPVFTVSFLLVAMVGIAALLVGVMQIVVITREREHYTRIWPVVLSGLSYVLLGLLLLFFPLLSAAVAMIIGGVLLVIFSFGLFGWAWRLYQRSKAA